MVAVRRVRVVVGMMIRGDVEKKIDLFVGDDGEREGKYFGSRGL